MTIHQRKAPCWVLDPNPYADEDCGEPHYDTEIEASRVLRELRRDRRDDPAEAAQAAVVRPKQQDEPCWIAECDSDGCNEAYEDGEDGGNHFGSPKTLMEWAGYDGWTQKAPDLVFCWTDRDEGEPAPPSPAEIEAAGQLRLPGVA